MKPAGRLGLCILAVAAGSVAALAQSVISARAGLIHYVEGQVYLGDEPIESKFGNFPEVKENGQLRTGEGRAEVLLSPGVFLRLGENSSFRMITNRLIDTRLEFLSGSAIVEAEDLPYAITVVDKDITVKIVKKGLYRFDSSPATVHVFDGLAEVTAGDKTLQVKDGHMLSLDTMAVSHFDKNATDAMDRWSARRAEYLSMANVSAANSLRTSGSLYNGGLYNGGLYNGGAFTNGWYWNPYFGMFTFVPFGGGSWYSPYGFRYWTPFDVYMAYMPGYYYYAPYYGGGGYSGGGKSARVYNSVAPNSVPVGARSASHPSSVISSSRGSYSGSGSSGAGSSSRSVSGGSSISPGSSSAPISHGGGGSVSHR